MPVSKPFAIATEGPTIDGRNIDRQWIVDMAKYYDPKVYTAVVNLEHFLSMLPDSLFSALGKVLSLSTQETEILGEKKLQLMAVVDVPQSVADMQKAGKKAFSSIEPRHNFLNKGISYLTGLAITDSPASVGTESMKFSTLSTDSIYASNDAIAIEFEPETAAPGLGESLFSKVKELLGMKGKKDDDRFADVGKATELIAASQRELLDKFAAIEGLKAELDKTNETITSLKAQADTDRAAFTALQEKLDGTPDGTSQRPAATGGDGQTKTDC